MEYSDWNSAEEEQAWIDEQDRDDWFYAWQQDWWDDGWEESVDRQAQENA
jgi:hypothetical protein